MCVKNVIYEPLFLHNSTSSLENGQTVVLLVHAQFGLTLPIVLKFISNTAPRVRKSTVQVFFSIPWKNNLHGKAWCFQLNTFFYLFGTVLSWLQFLPISNVRIVIWTKPLFCRSGVSGFREGSASVEGPRSLGFILTLFGV